MFTESNIGDSVWSRVYGWGKITNMYTEWDGLLCLSVIYPYHYDWKAEYKQRTGAVKCDYGNYDRLYHNSKMLPKDEYKFERPNLPVDTKMLVSRVDNPKFVKPAEKRHFSHWDEHDGVYCFSYGCSSFTNKHNSLFEHYDKWEIVEN